MTNEYRTVEQTVPSRAATDGAGVRIRRIAGVAQLDPFLMLDEFGSDDPDDYIAGFPEHPHRGFETVTYMLEGYMEHRDSAGNHGRLGPGSVQWMTAGRGILHSEMPLQEAGLMRGFQLWVNLPAKDKMMAPRYQELDRDEVPVVEHEGATVKVIAGRYREVPGAIRGVATDPTYLDVSLDAGAAFENSIPDDHTTLVYVFEGRATIGDGPVGASVGTGHGAVLGRKGPVCVATDRGSARFLLLAARPIGEPVVQYGPFVMNTRAEIDQAIEEYRAGRLA